MALNGLYVNGHGPDGGNDRLTDGSKKWAIPHQFTFAGLFYSGSKSYLMEKYDEALKDSRLNALAMMRDAWLMSLVRERIRGVTRCGWHLEVDNKNDPHQKQVMDGLTAGLKRTPHLRRMARQFSWATFYGRYGVQPRWEWDQVSTDAGPQRILRAGMHKPVNGDKLVYSWDDQWGVLINQSEQDAFGPGAQFIYATRGRALLLAGGWRESCLIHQFDILDQDYLEGEQAGGIGGVGLRHWLYWSWNLRDELLSWIIDHLERSGLGVVLIKYDQGNDEARKAAEDLAKKYNRQHVITIPVPPGTLNARVSGGAYGIEVVETPTAGIQVLDALRIRFEEQIERFIVGQGMSDGTDSTGSLGGTGRANFAQKTKADLIAEDAEELAETLTGSPKEPGLVSTMLRWSYPWADFPVRWRFDLETVDVPGKMEAYKAFVEMGGLLCEDEVRETIGARKPGPGEETLGGGQQTQGGGGDPSELDDLDDVDAEPDEKLGKPDALDAFERFAFDPAEPRDASGEWTATGGADPSGPDNKERRKQELKTARKGFRAAMQSVFGVDSQAYDDDVTIQQAGRELHLEYYPYDKSVFIEFTQSDVADPSAKATKTTAWDKTASTLQSGTVDVLHKFQELLPQLAKAGVGVHYETTEPRRRRIYAKALAAAGFEEMPSKDTEQSQWRPKQDLNEPHERFAFDETAHHRGQPGNAGQFGPGGAGHAGNQEPRGGGDPGTAPGGRLAAAFETAKSFLTPRGLAGKAKALLSAATHPVQTAQAVKDKVRELHAKFGTSGTITIVGGYLGYYTAAAMNPAMLTVPVPLNGILLICAKIVRYLEQKVRGTKKPAQPAQHAAGGAPSLSTETALRECKAFLAAVAGSLGEAMPQLDDGLLRQVLGEMLRQSGEPGGEPEAERFAFDPAEPRIPAGQPGGGEWTATGNTHAERVASWQAEVARREAAHGEATRKHEADYDAWTKRGLDRSVNMIALQSTNYTAEANDPAEQSLIGTAPLTIGTSKAIEDTPEGRQQYRQAAADFTARYVAAWQGAFGEGGALARSLAAVGAGEKELAKLAALGGKGRAAIEKAAQKWQTAIDRHIETKAKRDELGPEPEEPQPPDEPDELDPDDPDVTHEQRAASEAAQKQYEADHASYEKGYAAWETAHERWEERSEKLEDRDNELSDKADELLTGMDEVWSEHKDDIEEVVTKITDRLYDVLQEADEADEEPQEPDEPDYPEEPEEEEPNDEDDEDD